MYTGIDKKSQGRTLFAPSCLFKCQTQRFVSKEGMKDIGLILYRFGYTMWILLILAGLPIPVISRMIGLNFLSVKFN